MEYSDTIYGKFEITAPVIVDLLRADAVNRLKHILNSGISGLIGLRKPSSRFEHSVGVMYLVGKLGGKLEESIAALLHDISHTAFSHVIDYVVDYHLHQGYHERKKKDYIEKTDIPNILRQYNFDWTEFLEEDKYTLLEQPSPALCADRLDYFLRDSFGLGLLTLDEIHSILAHLVSYEDRIVVNDKEVARFIGKKFIEADDSSWSNLQEVGLYELTAQAIQIAKSTGKITEDDFWGTDEALWGKIQQIADSDLLKRISKNTRFVIDEYNPTFRVHTKIRTIDPDIFYNGKVKRLSEIDFDYATYRKDYLKSKEGLWHIRILEGTELTE